VPHLLQYASNGNYYGRIKRNGKLIHAADSSGGHRPHAAPARAGKEVGISRLTHHDFRRLFAIRCIESGADLPAVSRRLGHKEGGALAMKSRGRRRNEHSQAMAQKANSQERSITPASIDLIKPTGDLKALRCSLPRVSWIN
jgi:integrase